jgi:hypothetical protein
VYKSGICASTRTIASQWLVRLDSSVKAQVAHRFFVALFFRHWLLGGDLGMRLSLFGGLEVGKQTANVADVGQ